MELCHCWALSRPLSQLSLIVLRRFVVRNDFHASQPEFCEFFFIFPPHHRCVDFSFCELYCRILTITLPSPHTSAIIGKTFFFLFYIYQIYEFITNTRNTDKWRAYGVIFCSNLTSTLSCVFLYLIYFRFAQTNTRTFAIYSKWCLI